MTAPTFPAAETIRTARAQVAADITKSRRRITELSALLRSESANLANLQLIAEVVGVTDVGSDREPEIADANVAAPPQPGLSVSAALPTSTFSLPVSGGGIRLVRDAEAPPAVGTPTGP